MYKLSQKVIGAMTPLVAMVNPGKSAPVETIPPVVTSTYTLRYLPKLTRLTPLVIPAGTKSSAVPVVPDYNNASSAAKISFDIPPISAKLGQMPQLLTEESYKSRYTTT